MKKLGLTIIAIVCCVLQNAVAENRFPEFSRQKFTITVSTNLQYYASMPSFEVGSNAVYQVVGQVFTNASAGRIQTTAEGFSGTTDKQSPWKTLTELLAVYQQGCAEKEIRALYSADSKKDLDEIFSDPAQTSRQKKYGTSIKKMTVVMGFELKNGFVAFVSIATTDKENDVLPFYFVREKQGYCVSSYEDDGQVMNISLFLNTQEGRTLIPWLPHSKP